MQDDSKSGRTTGVPAESIIPPWKKSPAPSQPENDVFAVLRKRLEKALVGLSGDVGDKPPYEQLSNSTKPSRDEFPVPELVQFALATVLGFPSYGPEEKMRWSILAMFDGSLVSIELRKFGFTICAGEKTDLKRLCGQLQVAVKLTEQFLEPLAQEQVIANNVTIANRYSEFDRRYRFFRKSADAAYRSLKRKPRRKAKPPDAENLFGEIAESWNRAARANTRGFFHSVAMVDAYFSRLEHLLLLLRALHGKAMADGELKEFVGDLWDEKLRKLIDVTEPKAQKIYAGLKRVKERVRNPFSHGGMENDGGSLFVHVPSVGALPANFTGIKNSVRFNLYPMEKDDHGETCALFDGVDDLLRTGTLAAAYELMDAGIDPSFDKASIARFAQVAASPAEERAAFIDHWHYEQDRHDNMDY
jgi:hypothetical protein